MASAATVVTGAAGGIGSAIAARLAGAGRRLVLIDRRPPELPAGADGISLACDIADPASVAAAFQHIGLRVQCIDGLVNVAGRNLTASIEDMQVADWHAMLDVNVGGMLAIADAVLPLMDTAANPVIVNMASVAGYMASADHPAYVATKAGVEGLSQGLSHLLGPRGIRVHTVAPGWVDTGFTHAATASLSAAEAEALLSRAANQHLLRRIARPDEIADVVLWLLSPKARYLHGTTLFVDGGLMRVH
ncbi:MAG: SDR family oxidoreductase [Rhodobacter sp.]|nr:SDR family oxidoreductase [Rhodobacter sp.]